MTNQKRTVKSAARAGRSMNFAFPISIFCLLLLSPFRTLKTAAAGDEENHARKDPRFA
jgi:hypothetical protein